MKGGGQTTGSGQGVTSTVLLCRFDFSQVFFDVVFLFWWMFPQKSVFGDDVVSVLPFAGAAGH